MDLQGIALRFIPHFGQAVLQLAPGQDPPGTAGQGHEHLELPGAELHGLPIHGHLPGVGVHQHVADLPGAAGEAGAAAHQGPEAAQEFRHGEGLGQVVVPALVEALHPVLHRIPRREDEHRRAVVPLAHAAQDGQSGAVGQPEVQHHRLEAFGGQGEIGLRHGFRPVGGVAVLVQGAQQGRAQLGIVFHEQQSDAGVHGSILAGT